MAATVEDRMKISKTSIQRNIYKVYLLKQCSQLEMNDQISRYHWEYYHTWAIIVTSLNLNRNGRRSLSNVISFLSMESVFWEPLPPDFRNLISKTKQVKIMIDSQELL